MDKGLKRLVVGLSGFIGFLEDWKLFVGYNMEVERKRTVLASEKMIEKLKIDGKELNKIVEDIKTGKLRLDTIEKHEMDNMEKKVKESEVVVKQKFIDNIALHAMEHTCVACNRNKKRCLLRTSFTNANVAPYNDDENKCPYDQSKEV